MSQVPPAPPTKDDVLAILKAHRDLGPEFDSHLADQIIDLWGPATGKRRREPNPIFQNLTVRSPREGRAGLRRVMPVLGISIPLLAIAGGEAGHFGVLAVLGLDALVIILSTFFG